MTRLTEWGETRTIEQSGMTYEEQVHEFTDTPDTPQVTVDYVLAHVGNPSPHCLMIRLLLRTYRRKTSVLVTTAPECD
jgi:hypothetical protein